MGSQHTSYFPLKIIYIHSNDLSKNETSETFVINNALSLAEAGAQVHLFVTNRSTQSGKDILLSKFDLQSIPANLHLHVVKLKRKSHWTFYRTAAQFVKQPENEGALIITRKHSVLPHLLIAKRPGQKLIFETHDFFYDLSLRPDLKTGRRRKHSIIERVLFKKLDAIICLNKYQQRLYQERLKVPVRVFPTGYNLVSTEATERENLLLYIGAFEERKGIDNILNLAELLDQRYKVMVIGSRRDAESESVNSEVHKRGIEDRVEVKEWMSKKELNHLLSKAKIGLLPLKAGYFNEFLTVPLKYFDYAAFNLPVVASDFPSLKEYVEDGNNGFLVDWGDLKEVKRKVEQVMSDTECWERLSKNQQKKSKDLTWQKRAKQQLEYFAQITRSDESSDSL
ncbi:MAG: glycosyltransferase [Bacteroidota bacterium]